MVTLNLYNNDCLVAMNNIAVGSVDLVLCDPPYGTTACKWDTVIPFEPMWAAVKSVIKPNGIMVFTSAQPFTSKLVCSNLKDFKYDWTWRKPKGTGHLNAKKMPMRDKEDILVFYERPGTYNPQYTKGSPFKNKAGKVELNTSMTDSYGSYTNIRNDNTGLRYPKQVLDFGVVERGSLHPTQKPTLLLEYLIKTYTNEGETVLDFTMGSGSTGVACVNTKRNFIGIELDKTYFDVAEKRIMEANANA